jgi:2-polyprenyl-6-methoxyphenol hydroxylase-like FAD-dependent oxidoreductase
MPVVPAGDDARLENSRLMKKPSVLIVGGGPVGLALAGDLAWRGVTSQLVESSTDSIYQAHMDLVSVRTMEFCRRWGIVSKVEASTYNRDWQQDNAYVTSLMGYELGREPFPSSNETTPPPQSPQRAERCPQDMFDPILRTWVATLPGVQLRYRHELVDFTQDDRGVVAEVVDLDSGSRERVEASYLVGCDGPESTVAKILGIKSSGPGVLTHTTNIIFRSAHLVQLYQKGHAYRFTILSPEEGAWATIEAIDGWDRWRMSILRVRAESASSPVLPIMADARAAIQRAVGIDFDFEILSIRNWTRSELIADRFGAGRAFIAGDAAHLMSPSGGFGGNTGIGDAVDLSWKLDATLSGWGGPSLLDAYTIERRPVAERNAKESSENLARMLSPGKMPLLCEDSPAGAHFREEFGRQFTETMRPVWNALGIHLGYRYDDSPICWDDGTPRPPLESASYEQTSRPGARAPHVWLRDGRSTLDLFGRAFTLLQLDPAADPEPLVQAARERGVPLTVVACDEPEVRVAYDRKLVLVRPEGHVGWRGDAPPADPLLVIDCVRGASPFAWRARTTS